MAIVLNGTTGITTPDIDSTAGFDAADITGTIGTAQITDANVTQAKLAAEAVNEAKMQVSNAPTNGYMLTAQSGDTGGLTWAAAPTVSTTAGDVGTYTFGRPANVLDYSAGDTATGVVSVSASSGLPYRSLYAWTDAHLGVTWSGTWRVMSEAYGNGNQGYLGLWVRIS